MNILHGIDITNLNRIEFNNNKLVNKILSVNEYNIYKKLNSKYEKRKFIATHWAIKEAIIKALNNTISFKQINISKINYKYSFNYKNINFVISTSIENNFIFASVIAIV